MNDILRAIGIEAILKTVRLMELVFINGNLEKFMMGIGRKDLKAVMECGKEKTEKFILENGKTPKRMGLESTLGQTETSMKGSGRTL